MPAGILTTRTRRCCEAKGLKRDAKTLNHKTLPEISDFNALCDASFARYFVERFKGLKSTALFPEFR